MRKENYSLEVQFRMILEKKITSLYFEKYN